MSRWKEEREEEEEGFHFALSLSFLFLLFCVVFTHSDHRRWKKGRPHVGKLLNSPDSFFLLLFDSHGFPFPSSSFPH